MILYSPSQKAHFPPSKKRTKRGAEKDNRDIQGSTHHHSERSENPEISTYTAQKASPIPAITNTVHSEKSEESGKTPNAQHLNSQQATPPY